MNSAAVMSTGRNSKTKRDPPPDYEETMKSLRTSPSVSEVDSQRQTIETVASGLIGAGPSVSTWHTVEEFDGSATTPQPNSFLSLSDSFYMSTGFSVPDASDFVSVVSDSNPQPSTSFNADGNLYHDPLNLIENFKSEVDPMGCSFAFDIHDSENYAFVDNESGHMTVDDYRSAEVSETSSVLQNPSLDFDDYNFDMPDDFDSIIPDVLPSAEEINAALEEYKDFDLLTE